MKECSKCLQEKGVECFSVDRQKKDGLRSSCKLCDKKGLSQKEKQEIDYGENISKGYKICTKCNKRLPLENFRKDKTKIHGYCSACNDCYRERVGNKKRIPANIYICDFCGLKFIPRINQFRNKGGNIFCGRLCEHNYNKEHITSYYGGYRKYIMNRDGNKCFLCKTSNKLNIHHIKTRGSGGTDEYNNLLTLCVNCHISKAHGFDGHKYKILFMEYTSKFTRPTDWDYVMEMSERNMDRVKKHNNELVKKYYFRIKNSDKYKEYKEKRKQYQKKFILKNKNGKN